MQNYAIFMLSAEGLIASWNKGAARIKGYSKNQFLANMSHELRTQGTALGLALTRKIVEAQRGKNRVTSEVGKGSFFTVLLPLRMAAKQDH